VILCWGCVVVWLCGCVVVLEIVDEIEGCVREQKERSHSDRYIYVPFF